MTPVFGGCCIVMEPTMSRPEEKDMCISFNEKKCFREPAGQCLLKY